MWWETSVVGSGITENIVNESLTEVMAALDILKRIGLKPRVTVVAPGDSDDEYVMSTDANVPFSWGGFVINMLRNKKRGDGKLPHPLIPRGTAVFNAFEMDHELRVKSPKNVTPHTVP